MVFRARKNHEDTKCVRLMSDYLYLFLSFFIIELMSDS